MSRPRRIVLVAAVLVAVLAGAAALFGVSAPEWLRAELERQLQARLVPPLRLAGPLRLSFLPRPALSVGGIVVRDAAGQTQLAIREFDVQIDAPELFAGRLALSSVTLVGVDLVLRRDAAGHWNVASWLAGGSGGGLPAIGALVIREANMRVEGEPAAELTGLSLEAGPLGPGRTSEFRLEARAKVLAPVAAAVEIALGGGLRLVDAGVALQDVVLAADGELVPYGPVRGALRIARVLPVAGGGMRIDRSVLTLECCASTAAVALEARLDMLAAERDAWHGTAPAIEVRAERDRRTLTARLAGTTLSGLGSDWRLPQFALTVETGGLAPPARLALAGQIVGGASGGAWSIGLTASQGSAQLPHPAGGEAPLTVSFVGDAQLDPVARSASGALAGGFDRSRFEGSWRFEAGAVPPLGVALSIDRLTLDRYLPPARAASDPADLAAWRNWPVEADLRVGELRFRGLVSENARLQLSGGPEPSSAR